MKRRKIKGNPDVVAQYKRERRRILSYLRKKEREGYYTGNIIVPEIPKTVREGSVRRLQKMSAKNMRRDIYYISAQGEVAGINNRAKVKRLRYEDYEGGGIKTRATFDNFLNEVEQTGNRRAMNLVYDWISDWRRRDGDEIVAEALEEAARNGIRLEVEMYDSERRATEAVLRFARETFMLSGEYGEDRYVDDLMEELEEAFYFET